MNGKVATICQKNENMLHDVICWRIFGTTVMPFFGRLQNIQLIIYCILVEILEQEQRMSLRMT